MHTYIQITERAEEKRTTKRGERAKTQVVMAKGGSGGGEKTTKGQG